MHTLCLYTVRAERLADSNRWHATGLAAGSAADRGRCSSRSAAGVAVEGKQSRIGKFLFVSDDWRIRRSVSRDLYVASSKHDRSAQCEEQEASHITMV